MDKTLPDLLESIDKWGGFLDESRLTELAKLDRLRLVLVRCGNCRFTCAAQDAKHIIDILTAAEHEYVRDVSLPAGDPVHFGDYTTSVTQIRSPSRATAPAITIHGTKNGKPASFTVPRFDEADCGGSFDGFHVTSDADPGL